MQQIYEKLPSDHLLIDGEHLLPVNPAPVVSHQIGSGIPEGSHLAFLDMERGKFIGTLPPVR